MTLSLHLVPFYLAPVKGLTTRVRQHLQREYGLETDLHPPPFDPEEAFMADRGQYDATRLIEALRLTSHDEAHKVLALTSVDLCIPVLSYVFGEAELGGRFAVLSTRRLHDPSEPEELGSPTFIHRVVVESVHEVGHLFGLPHCVSVSCVMRASTFAEEIDLKEPFLCDDCRAALLGAESSH